VSREEAREKKMIDECSGRDSGSLVKTLAEVFLQAYLALVSSYLPKVVVTASDSSGLSCSSQLSQAKHGPGLLSRLYVTIKGTATKRASPQGAPNLFLIREWAHRKRRKKRCRD
jgi:hypothetical protein